MGISPVMFMSKFCNCLIYNEVCNLAGLGEVSSV